MPSQETDHVNRPHDLPTTDDIMILKEAGAEGWELVTIESNGIAYLKRQLDDDPVRPLHPCVQPGGRPHQAPSDSQRSGAAAMRLCSRTWCSVPSDAACHSRRRGPSG
jgi:hypothetical protein